MKEFIKKGGTIKGMPDHQREQLVRELGLSEQNNKQNKRETKDYDNIFVEFSETEQDFFDGTITGHKNKRNGFRNTKRRNKYITHNSIIAIISGKEDYINKYSIEKECNIPNSYSKFNSFGQSMEWEYSISEKVNMFEITKSEKVRNSRKYYLRSGTLYAGLRVLNGKGSYRVDDFELKLCLPAPILVDKRDGRALLLGSDPCDKNGEFVLDCYLNPENPDYIDKRREI